MTVQTVKLGREKFVLLREKDYRQLRAKAESRSSPVTKARRPSPQDRADAAVASRRRHEAVKPYLQLRKELGLV